MGEVFTRVTRRVRDVIDDTASNVLSITATVGFVTQEEKFGKVIAGKNLQQYVLLRHGEFSYNKGNSEAYPQGCVRRLEEFSEGAVPNVYYSFRPKSEQTSGDFYRYYFEAGLLNQQLSRRINSGVRNDGLLNLAPEDFFEAQILVPPYEEQEKIGMLFRTIDEEISATKNKLERIRAQKKGLMQRLLTGQMRVIS